ncbi:hypothetical protein ACFC58_27195 [Kitasatospora purpeofusca]|uniref:hypothetical protein n=1 Tax=Kitasatospora purpeofusca TaxID=67352 RepID=UPI0035D604AF
MFADGSGGPGLERRARAALSAAVAHAVASQRPDGSWSVPAGPRVLETAVAVLALRQAEGPGSVPAEALRWLAERAEVQQHHPAVAAADRWLLALALRPSRPPPLAEPPPDDPTLTRRHLLLHTVAVATGAPGADPGRLLETSVGALGPDRGAGLKGWQRTVLLAAELLAHHALGPPVPPQVRRALEAEQAGDGSFHTMALTTAVACLALACTAPGHPAVRAAAGQLRRSRDPRSGWGLGTFDVWDTALMVRCLRGRPEFDARALPAALSFLEHTQGPDGGWGSASPLVAGQGLASDNDTTGTVLLALAGSPQGSRVWPAARAYAATRQRPDGLWTTWQSSDDTPAQDVVAHLAAGIDAHRRRGDGSPDTAPARRWLVERHRADGRWQADWYGYPAYPAAEIAPLLGRESPELAREAARLAAAQRPDGGWPRLDGEDSASPAATALAVTALLHSLRPVPPGALVRALRFLVESRREEGDWPEPGPAMFGPRPFLSDVPAQNHALTCRGLAALVAATGPADPTDPFGPTGPAARR